jgi:dienelactone hydrolase
VSAKDLAAFEDEMRTAKVDWQLVKYGGAVHSFTDWTMDGKALPGAQYNPLADQRSWAAMRQFFDDLFNPSGGK